MFFLPTTYSVTYNNKDKAIVRGIIGILFLLLAILFGFIKKEITSVVAFFSVFAFIFLVDAYLNARGITIESNSLTFRTTALFTVFFLLCCFMGVYSDEVILIAIGFIGLFLIYGEKVKDIFMNWRTKRKTRRSGEEVVEMTNNNEDI